MRRVKKPDPFRPSISLLAKLGSFVVIYEEMVGSDGSALDAEADAEALHALLRDHEIKAWLKAMGAFVPAKPMKLT